MKTEPATPPVVITWTHGHGYCQLRRDRFGVWQVARFDGSNVLGLLRIVPHGLPTDAIPMLTWLLDGAPPQALDIIATLAEGH